ncbi:MAG: 50S ribosomal protein L29 [Candidatus Parcubacteria bacterium]|nr:50S ribosomal protein L29 [Candidatus Parcubacteria bacterium]
MKDEIKTKSDQDLTKDLTEKREGLRGMRFNIAGSKIKNVKEQKGRKKEIARILTELNARREI